MPAAELITEAARFRDEDILHHVTAGWLAGRDPAAAALELLTAAATMAPSARVVAVRIVEGLGEAALPAWREMTAASGVGPHARLTLAQWEQGPDIAEADWHWLAVEQSAVALAEDDPDEALTLLWESLPGEDIEACLTAALATGHPEAEAVVKSVTDFVASGKPRGIDQIVQLRIGLARSRPPIWRRVQIPATATLNDLHQVIQVLFGWGGDHLYLFTVGRRRYSGLFEHLEETGYDHEIRLAAALSEVKKITYVYDMGAWWEHEITLEKTLPCDPARAYPVCVGFHGDSPVEYADDWSEDDPEEPGPFDIDAVNRRLTGVED